MSHSDPKAPQYKWMDHATSQRVRLTLFSWCQYAYSFLGCYFISSYKEWVLNSTLEGNDFSRLWVPLGRYWGLQVIESKTPCTRLAWLISQNHVTILCSDQVLDVIFQLCYSLLMQAWKGTQNCWPCSTVSHRYRFVHQIHHIVFDWLFFSL